MLENNGFFAKTMGFFWENYVLFLKKKQCFWHDFTNDLFDYKAYASYQNKNYSCLTLTFFS